MITYLSVGALKKHPGVWQSSCDKIFDGSMWATPSRDKGFSGENQSGRDSLLRAKNTKRQTFSTKRYAALEIYARVDVSSDRPAEEVVMKWKAMTPVSSLVINWFHNWGLHVALFDIFHLIFLISRIAAWHLFIRFLTCLLFSCVLQK